MKELLQESWLQLYHTVTLRQLLLCALLIICACWLQYHSSYPLWQLQYNNSSFVRLSLIFGFFLFAGILFCVPATLIKTAPVNCWVLLLAAPLLFAGKVILPGKLASLLTSNTSLQPVWQLPLIWLIGCLFIICIIACIHRFREGRWSLYYLQRPPQLTTYLLLLVCMLPVLLLAASIPSFQQEYPKAAFIWEQSNHSLPAIFAFETAYLADFVSIELFFRGILVALLSQWLGKHSLLPIALFYFSIHLGKPLLEAVSSFGGGLLLGAMALQCRSIWGGWLVHAGIALCLEAMSSLL